MTSTNSDAQRLASVVLRHIVAGGTHYDWMIQKPGTDAGAVDSDRVLATWRVADPPDRWRSLGRFAAERIGDHRRVYLRYEGDLDGDRGSVDRIDAGSVRVERWGTDWIRVEVTLAGFRGGVELRRLDGQWWEATLLDRVGESGMISSEQ